MKESEIAECERMNDNGAERKGTAKYKKHNIESLNWISLFRNSFFFPPGLSQRSRLRIVIAAAGSDVPWKGRNKRRELFKNLRECHCLAFHLDQSLKLITVATLETVSPFRILFSPLAQIQKQDSGLESFNLIAHSMFAHENFNFPPSQSE